MEKVIRDGKVAVLYSPGYGSGWYTWNRDHPACIFDPYIVSLVESGHRLDSDHISDYCTKKYGEDFYCGSAIHQLKIKWLPVGTSFRISDYDGNESLVLSYDDWQTA